MIQGSTGLFAIGDLARATGLTVRTIRYWSGEGVLPLVGRSSGGYGPVLPKLRRSNKWLSVIRVTLGQDPNPARTGPRPGRRPRSAGGREGGGAGGGAHVAALDAQIRVLKVTRALLSSKYQEEFAWVVAALKAWPGR